MASKSWAPYGVLLGILALFVTPCDASEGSPPGSATDAAAIKLRGFDKLYKERMQSLEDEWFKTKMKWAGKACLLDDEDIKVRAEAAMACPSGEAKPADAQEW